MFVASLLTHRRRTTRPTVSRRRPHHARDVDQVLEYQHGGDANDDVHIRSLATQVILATYIVPYEWHLDTSRLGEPGSPDQQITGRRMAKGGCQLCEQHRRVQE